LAIELRLERVGPRQDSPAGWFLPGSDCRGWLVELARWGRPMLGLRCFVVPGPDGEPAGLFVLAPTPDAGPPSPRAYPYRRLGRRVYLPAEADLDPRPAAAELDACPGDPLLVHPSLGWIGFEPGDVLGPAELLASPPRRPGSWDRARRGPPPLPRLRGVSAERPPSLDRVFQAARSEIGVDPPRDPGAPPPARPPQEPGDPSSEADSGGDGRSEGGWLRRQADKLSAWWRGEETEPEPPVQPPDPEQLRRDRERELQRLARLLEEDPDLGLRRALPLGESARRAGEPSNASPGRQLPERELRLNLDKPRGPGRGESWDVSPQLHLLLMRRYREAANRELNLGRYERAAYVFLELLGDTWAAAKALEQGRHYHEAALLYQERLHQPLEAARCFERGGLLEQAARLFGQCGEDEQAAKLYRRLGQEPEAERHFRRAVGALKTVGDLRGAARLIERELSAPDEALEILAEAWPRHRQAGTCLRERFALLGRLGRHQVAGELVRELVEVPAPPQRVVALVEALERTASTYPAQQVAARARDGVRSVAGSRLPQAPRQEAEQLLRVVARSSPEDPLLARDVGRYVASVRGASPRSIQARLQRGELQTVNQIQLPRHVLWRAVVAAGRGFYAAGVTEHGAVAVRGRWDGGIQTVRWEGISPTPRGDVLEELLLAPAASPDCPSVLIPLGKRAREGKPAMHLTARLSVREFPADDAFVEQGRVGTPDWIPPSCLAVATSPVGVVFAVHGSEGALVLSALDAMRGGALLSTRLVASRDEASLEPAVHMLALRDRFFLAVGRRLEWREQDQVLHTMPLDEPATGLVASPRDSCLVVTHGQGATAFFSRRGGVESLPVGRDLASPRAAFTREGLLALFGRDEARCYEVRGQQLVHRGSYPWRRRPLALAPTHSHRFMAVFEPTGRVQIVELPAL